ncbi:MAG: methylenetetrahydrofolate reductase [Deltaproteobacteria bacterium]|nr:methylenetetrahydrofolate reductase [Deltaproteobacteria bacterium]
MSHLSEKMERGERVITAEITPPKGAGVKKLLQHATLLKPHVDAINITDCQRALVKMSSLAACKVLLDNGVEPVYQLTCRDRNSIALQSDLMGAGALGIPNLLCLTGDPVKVGDQPNAKSVFEIESTQLLKLVGSLQKGRDQSAAKMNAPTKFFVGAVVNPVLTNESSQLKRMEKKIEAGARFFQTQACYSVATFREFLKEAVPFRANVLAGILILHSLEIAQYLKANIPGVAMPDDVLSRLSAVGREAGIELAVETMLGVADLCQGFHLMTVREEEIIPEVLERYHARAR